MTIKKLPGDIAMMAAFWGKKNQLWDTRVDFKGCSCLYSFTDWFEDSFCRLHHITCN